jgi:hypothetical protein
VTDRPLISVCCMVNAPPGRVAAALAPLRRLAPEIVLAVDERVDTAWIERYRELADRVIVVTWPGDFGSMYAWMREQCRGSWIVQLDGDEVPAPALAAEIAATIAAGDVTHAWVPRRWLYPDRTSWLAQWPWRPDYSLRVLRNDPTLVRFPAQIHSTVRVSGPARYLRAPIYHADLLLADIAVRERKQALYERVLPGLVIDGCSLNEIYYLPERRADLRLAPVPPDDVPAVSAFLEAGPTLGPNVRRVPFAPVEHASAAELVRLSEARRLDEGAYRARLELLDDDLTLVSGEARTFDVMVTNLGTAHWPGGLEARPQIRLSHRWLSGPGDAPLEGARTPLPAALSPGAQAVVPLQVLGPPQHGAREIEIDLVHEDVRWFGCGVRTQIAVRAPAGRRTPS